MKAEAKSCSRADSRFKPQPSRDLSPRKTVGEPVCAGLDQKILERLRAALAALPAVRRKRVGALRRAIEDRRYFVSDMQIARALIDELLRRP